MPGVTKTTTYSTTDGKEYAFRTDAVTAQGRIDFLEWYTPGALTADDVMVDENDIVDWLIENESDIMRTLGWRK